MASAEISSLDDDWVAPFGGDGEDSRSLAPFASTPDARIVEMIELSGVGEDDVVADLGAGDGIVLQLVWKHSRAKKAVGYEINKELVETARDNLQIAGCPSAYTIEDCDVMEVDMSQFTVIFTW
jgi:predicted RNA methylase